VSATKLCARPGCDNAVKKLTNKYCSRACCAADPGRNERLRRASRSRLLPTAREIDLSIWGDDILLDPESEPLEEAPLGLSRLTAS
jgi:hypothetical protein